MIIFTPNTVIKSTEVNSNLQGLADGTEILSGAITPNKLSLGAENNFVTTGETTSSTSFVSLTTVQSITVTVGANGLLLVGIGSQQSNTGGHNNIMSFELSGSNTLAASDDRLALTTGTAPFTAHRTFLLTALNTGSTTITAKYRTGGGTATFLRRNIWAIPI